jgi:peroxiredoxin
LNPAIEIREDERPGARESSRRKTNRLKRAYMGLYFPMILGMAIHAGIRLTDNPGLVAWWGPLLMLLPTFGALAYVMLPGVARTSETMPLSLGLTLAAFVLSLAGGIVQPEAGLLPALYTLLGAAGWAGYVFWYSKLGGANEARITEGEALPFFELKTVDGVPVQSPSFHGQPLLLMFYRGNWCPLCTAQIRELAGRYQKLREAGVRVVFASPQPEEQTRRIAKKFDIEAEFLCDPGNQAARQLGLLHVDGIPPGMGVLGYDTDTVFPTVVVADAGGKVVYALVSDNYRVRPEPDAYLSLLGI